MLLIYRKVFCLKVYPRAIFLTARKSPGDTQFVFTRRYSSVVALVVLGTLPLPGFASERHLFSIPRCRLKAPSRFWIFCRLTFMILFPTCPAAMMFRSKFL